MTDVRSGRRKLVLIALMFAAPLLIATVLAFSGWLPEGRRNYGTLVDPPQQIAGSSNAIDGSTFVWATPQWHWTLIVRIPETCGDNCRTRVDQVGNLRISLGRHAAKLRIVADHEPLADSVLGHAAGVYRIRDLPPIVSGRLPAPKDDLSLALVDPAGYLMLTYPEHADLARVRKDPRQVDPMSMLR